MTYIQGSSSKTNPSSAQDKALYTKRELEDQAAKAQLDFKAKETVTTAHTAAKKAQEEASDVLGSISDDAGSSARQSKAAAESTVEAAETQTTNFFAGPRIPKT